LSFAVDLNVLLYASDEASLFAGRAKSFLESCAEGGELFCLAWTTVMGYLRLATHPAIFKAPLSPDEAMRNVEALVRLPHARLLSEEEGFWDIYRDVARGLAIRGNLVPDAHLAALLRQHGVLTLYTNDRDFRRFDFLKVRNPLE
jgi:toxin-antitoxin system PIN domain toxin